MQKPTSFRQFVTIDAIDVVLIVSVSLAAVALQRWLDIAMLNLYGRLAFGLIAVLILASRRALLGFPQPTPKGKTKAKSTLIEILALLVTVVGLGLALLGALVVFHEAPHRTEGLFRLLGGGGLFVAGTLLYRVNRRPVDGAAE